MQSVFRFFPLHGSLCPPPCVILESFTYIQQNTLAIQFEASEIMLASGCFHFSCRQWPLYSHKESKHDVRGRSSGCNGQNLLLLFHHLNRTRERCWWYSIPLTRSSFSPSFKTERDSMSRIRDWGLRWLVLVERCLSIVSGGWADLELWMGASL